MNELEEGNRKLLVCGPSHIIRLQDSIFRDELPTLENIYFFGLGGMPIWHQHFIDFIKDKHFLFDEIVILVPDFRFGNGVFSEPERVLRENDGFFMASEFLAIEPEHINTINDRELYENALNTIDYIISIVGDKLKLIFWCLAGREVQNIKEGRYLDGIRYEHPIWNYQSVFERYLQISFNVYDDIKSNYDKYIKDRSCHPTMAGFILILEGALGLGFDVTKKENFYSSIRSKIDQAIKAKDFSDAFEMSRNLTYCAGYRDDVLITGSLAALEAGRTLDLVKWLELRPFYKNLPIVVMSRLGFSLYKVGRYEDAIYFLLKSVNANSNQPGTMYYLSSAYYDNNEPLKAYIVANLALSLNQNPSSLSHLEKCLVAYLSEGKELNLPDIPVLPDVVVGSSKEIFLLGGAHKIQSYLNGSKVPEEKSYSNFIENLNERMKLSMDCGAKYLHIIFPDKQSISPQKYPFFQSTSLGRRYTERVMKQSSLSSVVCYPVPELQSFDSNEDPVLIQGDSHISDSGFMVVFKTIMQRIIESPEEFDFSINYINSNIHSNKIKAAGDLGSKFTPPLFSYKKVHTPSINISKIDNGVLRNDGLAVYWFNPGSPSNKKVLIFGDSYFNLMSKFFSVYYREVLFLRTRFFHREVLKEFEADIVFTGNAERYLSRVESDEKAALFSNYLNRDTIDFNKYKIFCNKLGDRVPSLIKKFK